MTLQFALAFSYGTGHEMSRLERRFSIGFARSAGGQCETLKAVELYDVTALNLTLSRLQIGAPVLS